MTTRKGIEEATEEDRVSCSGSLRRQRTAGRRDKLGGLAVPLPIAPLISLVGSRKGKNGRGNGSGGDCTGSFVLIILLPLLPVGILGEVPGEGLNRISMIFPPVLFQGGGLHGVLGARAGVTSQCDWSGGSHGVSAFAASLGLELNYNGGLDVIFRRIRKTGPNVMTREMPGEDRSPWGQGSRFPSFAPCEAPRLSALGSLCT